MKPEKSKMKLRVRLAFLKRAADAMEKMARSQGMEGFVALSTRASIRRLRIGRPEKRRARKWTTK